MLPREERQLEKRERLFLKNLLAGSLLSWLLTCVGLQQPGSGVGSFSRTQPELADATSPALWPFTTLRMWDIGESRKILTRTDFPF